MTVCGGDLVICALEATVFCIVCTGFLYYFVYVYLFLGTAVAQWLRCSATNRKVAGSIPAGVTGIFH